MFWNGIRIVESQHAMTSKVKRVRGGYLNRWLIRAVVQEPCAYMIDDHTLVVHPTILAELRTPVGFCKAIGNPPFQMWGAP